MQKNHFEEEDPGVKDHATSPYESMYTHYVDAASRMTKFFGQNVSFPQKTRILTLGIDIHTLLEVIAPANVASSITTLLQTKEEKNNAVAAKHSLKSKNVKFSLRGPLEISRKTELFDVVLISAVLGNKRRYGDSKAILESLKSHMRHGAIIMIVEIDFGSFLFYPSSDEIAYVWSHNLRVMAEQGCDPRIGALVSPLLKEVGFRYIEVIPFFLDLNKTIPHERSDFIQQMVIEPLRTSWEMRVLTNSTDDSLFKKAIDDINRTTLDNGSFYSTFTIVTGLR